MSAMDQVVGATDAEMGPRVLIAAVHPKTGQQRVNLTEAVIAPPWIELRCAGHGFPWHDREGNLWFVEQVHGISFWKRR